jgi:hypothetical protein
VGEYLAALVATLHDRGVTAVCIDEASLAAGDGRDDLADPFFALADNVVMLQRGGMQRGGMQPWSTLTVVKMRFSAHDGEAQEFAIVSPGGIKLRRSFPDGEDTA